MALIAMAVYDTEENQRSNLTERTLYNLIHTTSIGKHRLVIVDNESCDETVNLINQYKAVKGVTIIRNETNSGTANAINKAWKLRESGEHCLKIDNDVEIHYDGWLDILEEVITKDPTIGQVGLKRKDCWENPNHSDPFYKTELTMLPHNPGEKWIIVEKSHHIMGTCVLHSSALLDKVGYLFQPRLYGFDDALMSARSELAGFKNVFIPWIELDHIDKGDTPYQKWKEEQAGTDIVKYMEIVEGYKNGTIPIYYNPYE